MTNLEQYARSVQTEKWWWYFFCRGCEACPARTYCHAQPSGTCCRENFLQWAGEETAEPPSGPLTLDELRGMDGEPVWVQDASLPQDGQWAIVSGVDTCDGERTLYCQGDEAYRDYGEAWLAYRRKPDGVGSDA